MVRENGAPGKIRTPNPLIRSQVLYPVELRARGGNGIQLHTGRGNEFESRSGAELAYSPHCGRNVSLQVHRSSVNGYPDRGSVNRLVSAKSIE